MGVGVYVCQRIPLYNKTSFNPYIRKVNKKGFSKQRWKRPKKKKKEEKEREEGSRKKKHPMTLSNEKNESLRK